MDEEDLLENARAYASRRGLEIGELLGSGVHGIIQVVESKAQPGKTALKVHHDTDAYLRERRAYERLREANVLGISGFHVPQLVHFDDELMAMFGIHMLDPSPNNIRFE